MDAAIPAAALGPATTRALDRLVQIAADAGKYIRTSSTLKPDEAAILLAEIDRLRALAGEAGAEFPLTRASQPRGFAQAA